MAATTTENKTVEAPKVELIVASKRTSSAITEEQKALAKAYLQESERVSGKIVKEPVIRALYVVQGWSPNQISRVLTVLMPDAPTSPQNVNGRLVNKNKGLDLRPYQGKGIEALRELTK